MRRSLSVFLIISCIFLCISCSKTPASDEPWSTGTGESVLLLDFTSPPGYEGSVTVEQDAYKTYPIYESTYTDPDAEPTHALWIDGAYVRGTYSSTQRGYYAVSDQYKYEVKDSVFHTVTEFTLNEKGELVEVDWASCSHGDSEKHITEEEAIEKAKSFLQKHTAIRLEDYTVNVKILEWGEPKPYFVTFTKYIGEIETNDRAEITIEQDGCFFNFDSSALGEIPTDTIIKYDMEKIDTVIRGRLDELYAPVRELYDKVVYDIRPKLFMPEKGSFALIYTVDVRLSNSAGNALGSSLVSYFVY